MISSAFRNLVSSARDHARHFHDDTDHTVSAALLTASGRTVLGINAFHFLGAPCGEISALAQHASTAPDDPVVGVVAVYGPRDEVIPPCGKCRQVFHDIDPRIEFVVRGHNGLETRTAAELLPHAFDPSHLESAQTIYMWEGYEESIRSGDKTQTIRVDDPFAVGPARIVFEKESGETTSLDGTVRGVRTIRRQELTEEHAHKDGFADLRELHTALDTHYPGLDGDDPVDVVDFELIVTPE